ncbi:WD40-repeat-containing domain protein [Choanephora cucurbitarum]|nr:WD40-repeat-containing domain protein [Choanephora cucurbitarum]
MDAQWWYESKDNITAMALVFGHNQFAIYDLTSRSLQFSAQCQVRCILYSARIYGHNQQDLIVASGTVFNQVHLWRPHIRDDQGDAIVYRQLLGHEGVIFGIRFNQDASQLVSVSDDRTIRVWSLLDEKPNALVLFGHTARIWDCQFVGDYLISNSEDATCRVWKNELDEEDRGECIACWEGHASKNVWSCAIDPAQTVVATGGQDSGIRLWSLHAIKNNKIDSEDDLVAFPLVDTKDTIRNFVMTKDRYLIAATTEGYLLKCCASSQPTTWQTIQHDPSYRNYAIMKSSACGRVVVVGNIVGDLVILSPTDAFEPFKVAAHKQKLFEIFIETSIANQDVLYIVSNGYNDTVLFHQLDLSTLSKPTLHTQFLLEMPIERTTVMSLGYAEDQRILVCGSRESALLIYRLPSPNDNIQPLKPLLQLRKSHGKQAVTGVLIKPSVSSPIVFWTTGRDGCYIQYRLTLLTSEETTAEEESTQLGVASQGDIVLSGQDMVLEQLYRNRVTKGTLEGALWKNDQLLLLGFFKKSFFVYNEANHFVAVAIHCGGGHRRWGFHTLDEKLHHASFAFIRKEVLYAYLRDEEENQNHFYDSILQPNYHGREVRALRFFTLSSKLFFATGGEDTLLRIQQYTPQGPQLHVSIRKHTTVIKSMDVSQGQALLLFTSGGLEEFRCWKIEEMDKTVHCLELASCPTLTEDMESRIMDTSVFALDGGLHIIGAVYSDAMIRIWLFNEQTRQFSLLADGTWHAKCILQMSHVRQDDQVYFFTSATDGQVAVWNLGQSIQHALENVEQLEAQPTQAAFKLITPDFYYRVHMSGVNALETVVSEGKKVWIMTGGEDNAVSIAELDLDQMCLSGKPCVVPHAHASSVTGIKWIGQTLWTISTDQRLNQWHLSDNKTLELIRAVYMDVPDPSALDAILYNQHVHVATTGVGLQSIRYPCS